MAFLHLLILSVQSSSLILLVAVTGYCCAKYGILNASAQKGLSQLTIKLLMPCLLFAQVAESIDADTLLQLWPLPIFFIIISLISGLLGLIGGKIFNFSSSQTRFVATGIIFNNVTSLPIGLIQSLVATEAISFLLWGDHDTPKKAAARGISYALLNTLLANILRFSFGTWLLKKEGNIDNNRITDVEQVNTENTPLLSSSHQTFRAPFSNLIYKIKEFMNPPLYAALIAIIVGTIPTIKSLFFKDSTIFYIVITRPAQYIGDIAIPLTILLLGAQLNNLSSSKSREILGIISYIMTCRFIIMPIIGILLVVMTREWYFKDPMLWFVMMMTASGPSAINIMNMAQITGTFQEEVAALLAYSYLALAPMVTVFMMIMLGVIERLTNN
ncbi:6236_t:CDS:2 [Ambispora gerdemannii]|uniref:6236_t:CDS:1 n=1 Tax=Ambispora gerdemannii TaxID=144530 RepID=A0A9N8YT92_9GLOM|nr:6236_t:CDS:2 [Ambispora gerdemannii]